MQESSPLLLPTRPTSQHDDESNQNNAQQRRYPGRKKKKKLTTLQDKVADATRLLKEQIAKANIITQSHGPSAFSRLEDSQQSPASTSSGTSRGHPPQSPFSPTTPDVTNYNETDSYSYGTTTSLFTSSESSDHRLLHRHDVESRVSSSSVEVMDISSPPASGLPDYYSPPLGVVDYSSPSTAVTDNSPPLQFMGLSSPPLEAMGYYSPPPMIGTVSSPGLEEVMEVSSPPIEHDIPDYSLPSPPVEPTRQYSPIYVAPPVYATSPSTNKKTPAPGVIDWGSDTEEEEEEEEPSISSFSNIPQQQQQQPRPDVAVTSDALIEGDQAASSRVTQSPTREDEAQDMIVEEELVVAPITITESEVDKLHTEKIENLNGNYDSSGSFREWHETLRVQTYGGEELLILPYTVIDF